MKYKPRGVDEMENKHVLHLRDKMISKEYRVTTRPASRSERENGDIVQSKLKNRVL